ncbi:MAG: hydrogenase maturation nickel metallochaperone HypA [Cyanobacteria bacterium P01_E01_bin.42]
MHELGITRNIVAIACDCARGAPIRRIQVEIGRLSAIESEAVRFCFDICAEETLAERAELEIIETPGRGRCRACDRELEMDLPYGRCTCGSTQIEIIQGQELTIKELETDALCA